MGCVVVGVERGDDDARVLIFGVHEVAAPDVDADMAEAALIGVLEEDEIPRLPVPVADCRPIVPLQLHRMSDVQIEDLLDAVHRQTGAIEPGPR